jgi:hypothetical protein
MKYTIDHGKLADVICQGCPMIRELPSCDNLTPPEDVCPLVFSVDYIVTPDAEDFTIECGLRKAYEK